MSFVVMIGTFYSGEARFSYTKPVTQIVLVMLGLILHEPFNSLTCLDVTPFYENEL